MRILSKESDFLSGKWSFHQEGQAQATLRKSDSNADSYEFRINASGAASNSIQWFNSSFPIEKGRAYRVSFTARSNKPLSFPIALMKSGAPWSSYGAVVRQQLSIGEEPSRQEVVFSATSSAEDARVTFYLGKAPVDATFSFSDFAVEEVEVDALELAPDVGNIILDGKKAAYKRWTKEDLQAQDDFWYDRDSGRVFYYSKENPATLYSSIEAAVMRHVIDLSGVHDAVFDNLDLRYGAAHGFGGSGNARVRISNCDISWIGGGDQYAEGGAGRRVRFGNGIEFWSNAHDHLVENCRIWEVYDAALTNQGSGENAQINITYRNNLIWNCEYSFEYWNRDEKSRTENIVFTDNICLRAGYGWGHEQRPDKNGRCLMFYSNTAQTKNFVVRGNVFADATDSLVRSDIDWVPEQPEIDQNQYWQSNSDLPYFFLNRYETIGQGI